MTLTYTEQKIKLYDLCLKFIDKNDLTCAETTCEDRVYENAPEFVQRICEIVGYKEFEKDE